MRAFEDVVGAVEYPGRALALGRDQDGVGFAAYWLTGRSTASRQRKLVVSDDEIVVQDVSGGSTDDLRHYTATIRDRDWIVVGNGTQVTELAAARRDGRDLQVELRKHAYEPDPPIRTPRIFATASTGLTGVTVGSASSLPRAPELVQHPSLYLAEMPPATSVTISTYAGRAADVITSGVPEVVATAVPWTSMAELIWTRLNPELRVALLVTPLDGSTFAKAMVR